jgi:hypothetical protein
MVFRRGGDDRREEIEDEDEDGLNIISDEDDEADEEEGAPLFEEGQRCDVCERNEGRVGLDPTCRGAYDGDPILYCFDCLGDGLRAAWRPLEGVAVIVEPFGEYTAHYYYRLDEMPAYQFVREDIEGVSWLMLTIGGPCARCGEQGHYVWLPPDAVDRRLPEGQAIFRDLGGNFEHLCPSHAADALARTYRELGLPLLTVELPRGAMGILVPTGD